MATTLTLAVRHGDGNGVIMVTSPWRRRAFAADAASVVRIIACRGTRRCFCPCVNSGDVYLMLTCYFRRKKKSRVFITVVFNGSGTIGTLKNVGILAGQLISAMHASVNAVAITLPRGAFL